MNTKGSVWYGSALTPSPTNKNIHEVFLGFNIHCAFVRTAESGHIGRSNNVRVFPHSSGRLRTRTMYPGLSSVLIPY